MTLPTMYGEPWAAGPDDPSGESEDTVRFARQDIELRVHHVASWSGRVHHVSEDETTYADHKRHGRTWCGKNIDSMHRVFYRVDCKRCAGFSIRCRDCIEDMTHKDRPLGLDIPEGEQPASALPRG